MKKPARVLIIDASKHDAAMMAEALRAQEYEVETFDDRQQGLERGVA